MRRVAVALVIRSVEAGRVLPDTLFERCIADFFRTARRDGMVTDVSAALKPARSSFTLQRNNSLDERFFAVTGSLRLAFRRRGHLMSCSTCLVEFPRFLYSCKMVAMGQSGRERHRDREPGRRLMDEEPPGVARVFCITDAQRQRVAKSLRYIDEARRVLKSQQNPDNREIIRELKASADQIFDVMNELEEIA